jgi:hypothetical protein
VSRQARCSTVSPSRRRVRLLRLVEVQWGWRPGGQW